MDPATAMLISGGINSGGNVMNALIAGQQNRKAREWAQSQSDIAYQRDIESWERNNAYNSPLAQIERLKAAGMSPSLMYSGTIQNSTTSTPSYHPAQGTFGLPEIVIPDVISKYQDIKLKEAQIDNINKMTEVNVTREKLLNIQTLMQTLKYNLENPLTFSEAFPDLSAQGFKSMGQYSLEGKDLANRNLGLNLNWRGKQIEVSEAQRQKILSDILINSKRQTVYDWDIRNKMKDIEVKDQKIKLDKQNVKYIAAKTGLVPYQIDNIVNQMNLRNKMSNKYRLENIFQEMINDALENRNINLTKDPWYVRMLGTFPSFNERDQTMEFYNKGNAW